MCQPCPAPWTDYLPKRLPDHLTSRLDSYVRGSPSTSDVRVAVLYLLAAVPNGPLSIYLTTYLPIYTQR